MANALGFQHRIQEALSITEEILREEPKDDQARHLWASLAITRGDPQSVAQATKQLEDLAKRMPENPVLRYNLGRAYAAAGDVEKATMEFQKAAKTKDYLPPRYEMARLALDRQQYGTARQIAEEILQIEPFNLAGNMLRATALAGLKQPKPARNIVEAILARLPRNRDALYLLARLKSRKRTTRKPNGFSAAFSRAYRRTFGAPTNWRSYTWRKVTPALRAACSIARSPGSRRHRNSVWTRPNSRFETRISVRQSRPTGPAQRREKRRANSGADGHRILPVQ